MQSAKPRRFLALDSMRGLCAIIVAIYHFSSASYIGEVPFIKNGLLFVDFFFVLSGFVIAASYEKAAHQIFYFKVYVVESRPALPAPYFCSSALREHCFNKAGNLFVFWLFRHSLFASDFYGREFIKLESSKLEYFY
jgi:hypothetical protein